MSTERQIQANRQNAQHATGPRTAEGKARSSRNALQHGLLSRQTVLETEDAAEFEAYRVGMIQALDPQDQVEAMLADRVVANGWRMRRVYRIETEMLMHIIQRDDAGTASEYDKQGCSTVTVSAVKLGPNMMRDFGHYRNFECLHRYESPIDRAFYKALHELERRQNARRGVLVPPPLNDELARTTPSSPPGWEER